MADPPVSLQESLARDEALMRSGRPGSGAALMAGVGLVLGVNQRDDIGLAARARAEGVPVLRRSTGGSAVLVGPGDVAWTVVVPRDDPRVLRGFTGAYDILGDPVVEWLARVGVSAAWEPPRALSDELCLLGSRGRVLVVGGKVVGGAAQRATAALLLHHGVVLRDVDSARTARLFDTNQASVTEHLGGIGGSMPPISDLRALLAGFVEPVR